MGDVNWLLFYIGCAAFVYTYMAVLWTRKNWFNIGLKLSFIVTAIFSATLFYACIKWHPVAPPLAYHVLVLPVVVGYLAFTIWDRSDGANKVVSSLFLALGIGGTILIIPSILLALGI